MEENWVPYMRATEQGAFSCMIDVEHKSAAPDRERPLLTRVHVAMKEPGEEGLGAHDEANRIDDLFEAVSGSLPGGAVFVARTRRGGRMSFSVYSPAGARGAVAEAARGAFAGFNVEVEQREDPSWEEYRALLPTVAEERTAADARVVQALQEHGDPLTPKRDVRHYAYFPSEAGARSFADLARHEGFRVERSPPSDERPEHGVIASRHDSVDLESIVPITLMLTEYAGACGGEYDGWEAALVRRQGLLGRLFGR